MKFELEPYNRGLPDEGFLDDLRRVASELGTPILTREQYEGKGRFHPSSVANRFGGWLKAVSRAGLQVSRRRDVSAEECLNDLRQVAEQLGKSTVSRDDNRTHGLFIARHYYRHFGSWESALHAAGLTVSERYHRRMADEEYFQNLEAVWRTLGRQPTKDDMFPPLSQRSASAYARRFGSWRKALEAFVTFVNSDTPSSDEKDQSPLSCSTKLNKRKSPQTVQTTNRTVSWRMRFLVMRRDNFRCLQCGASPALSPGVVLHVDHVIAWSKGGETVFENLQTLCEVCNIGKCDLPNVVDT